MWTKSASTKYNWKSYWQRLAEPTSRNDVTALFRNISMHAYNKLVAPQFNLYEKFIWLLVHITTMSCLLFVLIETWEDFAARYIVVNLVDARYPVEEIPFPAVTICDTNRISRKAATIYAKHLSDVDPMNRGSEYFMSQIELFIQFYYKHEANRNYDEYEEFQTFLDTYDLAENDSFYDTKRKMKELSSTCEDLILHCMLSGRDIDCFSPTAFETTATMYGYCCTFNKKNSYKKRPVHDRFLHKTLGLTVILNSSTADDLVPLLNINGFIVIIHDPNVYPDISSGSSREVFCSHDTEAFVAIQPFISDTTSELRLLAPNTRKCFFNDEAPDKEIFVDRSYHFANCLTRCRMRSLITLCRCIPFNMPKIMINNTEGVVYCTLQHLACLQRYNFKWNNVITERDLVGGLEREIEEALYCPQCMASCDDIQYDPSLVELPIESTRAALKLSKESLRKYATSEISILRVHFREAGAKYYRRTIGNSWFEALYMVGNLSSIILGFSVVAVFEIGFFVVRGCFKSSRNFLKNNSNSHKRRSVNEEVIDENKLYICP